MKQIVIFCLFLTCQLLTAQDRSVNLRNYSPHQVLQAILEVESFDGKYTYNRHEPLAVGPLQQFPAYVRDVNRILGYPAFKLSDRKNKDKAIMMFWLYQQHYNPSLDPEKMIRIHCGGPDGWKEPCTLDYLELVKKALKD